jgi:beta-glucosidase-like glycosyl hydrolase/CubicO group peptidase (beta-lactamase class C family)
MKRLCIPAFMLVFTLSAFHCSKGLVPSSTTILQPPVIAAPVQPVVPEAPPMVVFPVIPDPDPTDNWIPPLDAPSPLGSGPINLPLIALENHWVDSVFASMTDDARIGQLLMLRAHSDKGAAYEAVVEEQIKRLQPGGICFFQGTIDRQANLTNRYQVASRTPLMVSMDAEYGLGMRLSGAITYPRQMTLGAIRDDQVIYNYGREMARQCRRLGVHISFSPDADVNNNPANPVINDRSFGDDRNNVAAKAARYMMGLQDGGVLACAKHFPGHGDTDKDSHFSLPVINHSAARLDSLELFPFKTLIKAGVASFMVAHLNVPAYEPNPRTPSTLSRNIITSLLREKLHFEGLIFTDAMEMKAVADSFPAGIADLKALQAGNDVVLLPVNPYAAFDAIKAALADSTYNRDQFNASVKRMLRYKYRLGLTTPQSIKMENIVAEVNAPESYLLKKNMYRQALTLVRDRDSIAGISDDLYWRIGKTRSVMPSDSVFHTLRIATLAVGDTNLTIFQKQCGLYAPMTHFGVDTLITREKIQWLLDTLSKFDLVFVSHHKTRSKAMFRFGLTNSELDLIGRLKEVVPMALTVFGNPYSLKYFDDIPSLMLAFTEDPMAQETAAQAWFGAADIVGRLPVQVSDKAGYQQGKLCTFKNKRLAYDFPEAVGMRSDTLALIDGLVKEMIDAGAAPGCQVLVVKNGKVVWNKAYGAYTYEQMIPVTTETLFDMASVTKVAATTLSLMKLVNNGQLAMNRPVAAYVPELMGTNKKDLIVNEVLAHQAGLQPWIAFYKNTIDAQNQPLRRIYQKNAEPGFDIPVAKDLWMRTDYRDSVWQQVYDSPLRSDKSYKYSDLTMFLMARTIKNISGKTVDVFADDNFYGPLGLRNFTYNPWAKGLSNSCAPTEMDQYFRQEIIQGYVHDMGAAMLGGVSGHAGLFGNANDLAKIFQMLLNGGTYAGREYLMPETVKLFTTRFPGSSRRGLGFDMKETDPKATMNMSTLASDQTFGHTGFTGNAVWADPDQQLIFIFLSNRTYPSMDNNKLITGDYRPRIQSIVYRAIVK